MPQGQERPVAFASRTMTSAERNYSQLEREALAIIYAVNTFYQYIYGRHFVLITDHQPLMTILSPSKGIPSMAAARLQRWAINLNSYLYNMEFKYSKDNASADALSRLPCLSNTKKKPEDTFHLRDFDNLSVTAKQLATGTRRDPTLAKVLHWTRFGWPSHCSDTDAKPYLNRRHELSMAQDCLLWGTRVIMPVSFRDRLLEELHAQHVGASRIKALARSHFWWPHLHNDIGSRASSCASCKERQDMPASAPLQHWKRPATP